MSDLVTSPPSLLRIPRELRDLIFTYAFEPGYFLNGWAAIDRWAAVDPSDKNALFRELPGLCQANRQLFHEATPIFLAREIVSRNTPMSKQFLELYSHFPGEAATKGVGDFSIFNWTEEGTPVQLELISQIHEAPIS